MCIKKQRFTPDTTCYFCGKADIYKEVAQKNGGNREVDRDADRTNTKTNLRKTFIMCSQPAKNFMNMLRL